MSFSFFDYCKAPPAKFWDRDNNGIVTISDWWKAAGDILTFPGDWLIEWLIVRGKGNPTSLATFLELDCGHLGGVISTILSLIAWAAAFLLWGLIFSIIDGDWEWRRFRRKDRE